MTAPPLPLRRKAMEALTRGALAALTFELDLAVEDRRAHAAHVEAIINDKATSFADALRLHSRDDLKAICTALDLDASGKEKEPIVQRILAADEGGAPTSASVPRVADSGPTRYRAKASKTNGGDLGFENKIFQAADKLRNNMDAAEYKHVVLGLIFLKYINDAFEEVHARLVVPVIRGSNLSDNVAVRQTSQRDAGVMSSGRSRWP